MFSIVVTISTARVCGGSEYSVQPIALKSRSSMPTGKMPPSCATWDDGLMSSSRSSGPHARTIAGVPSWPSFTISTLVAWIACSMLTIGWISKKLSLPCGTPASTISASIRLPP